MLVSISKVARFIEQATQVVPQLAPGCRVLAFGHVGNVTSASTAACGTRGGRGPAFERSLEG